MKIKFIFSVLILICFVCNLQAQSIQDSTTVEEKKVKAEKSAYGVFDIFDGNPGKSALYSLMIPGAGQLYNKRYWKVPIVWAVEGAAIVIMANNIKAYKESNHIWECMVINGPKISNGEYVTADEYKFVRDNNRQQMEYSILVVALIHIVNIADAFVDRHLIEFDVEDDIGLDVRPSKYGMGVALQLNF